MKQDKTWRELHIDEIEFIKNADNVYRTRNHIVAQKLTPTFSGREMISLLGSADTYYTRTAKRDAEYDLFFADRGPKLEGKRIRTAYYTRTYIK